MAVTGVIAKREAYERIKRSEGLSDKQVAFVGDDVIDLPLAGLVGCFLAPKDAHALVLGMADHVLSLRGGRGVAREAAEYILSAGGLDLEAAYRPLLDDWGSWNVVQ